MRITVDIDPEVWTEAMEATGQTTKRGTVEEALRRIVEYHRQTQALRSLRGMGWEGDLDAMREGRQP
jgi:Arc/MetJ family transcription regulator